MKPNSIILIVALICFLAIPSMAACPDSDLNGDCIVDFRDFAWLAQEWLAGTPTDCSPADLTGDCFVDVYDLAFMADPNQWLTSGTPGEMVKIHKGTFQMGDNVDGMGNSLPLHMVTLSPFYMGKNLITYQQFIAFLNAVNPIVDIGQIIYASADTGRTQHWMAYGYCPYLSISGSPLTPVTISYNSSTHKFTVLSKDGRSMNNDPIMDVSWDAAAAYCNWRSQQEGLQPCYGTSGGLLTRVTDFTKNGYRLPTEAEWEYAARGWNTSTRFPWGDTITPSNANYYSFWRLGVPRYSYDLSTTATFNPTWGSSGNYPYTSPVGSFPANSFGLYDMTGNLRQWVNDWWGSSYSSAPQTNPTGPAWSGWGTVRGGSWTDSANYNRVCYRTNGFFGPPDGWCYHTGFRIVRNFP